MGKQHGLKLSYIPFLIYILRFSGIWSSIKLLEFDTGRFSDYKIPRKQIRFKLQTTETWEKVASKLTSSIKYAIYKNHDNQPCQKFLDDDVTNNSKHSILYISRWLHMNNHEQLDLTVQMLYRQMYKKKPEKAY